MNYHVEVNGSFYSVPSALARQNVEIPGGRLTGAAREEGVRTLGRMETAAACEDRIGADLKGSPVRGRDGATVGDGEEDRMTPRATRGA